MGTGEEPAALRMPSRSVQLRTLALFLMWLQMSLALARRKSAGASDQPKYSRVARAMPRTLGVCRARKVLGLLPVRGAERDLDLRRLQIGVRFRNICQAKTLGWVEEKLLEAFSAARREGVLWELTHGGAGDVKMARDGWRTLGLLPAPRSCAAAEASDAVHHSLWRWPRPMLAEWMRCFVSPPAREESDRCHRMRASLQPGRRDKQCRG